MREPSEAWAQENDVPFFASAAELADKVDYFAVLAPSNPERHWEICQGVFPLGKQTFVDKTFAPDVKTAREIFELADSYSIAIQSTSALRSTNVQQYLRETGNAVKSMFITAAGPSFDEYGIHPVELAISCLGAEATGLMRLGSMDHPRFLLKFANDHEALIDFNQMADVPFSATLTTDEGFKHLVVDGESLFVDAAASILDFFEAGEPLIDPRETLAVRRILDVAMSDEADGAFVDLAIEGQAKHATPAPHWNRTTTSQPSPRIENERT